MSSSRKPIDETSVISLTDYRPLKKPNVIGIDTPPVIDTYEHLVYLEMLSGHEIDIPVVADCLSSVEVKEWKSILFH